MHGRDLFRPAPPRPDRRSTGLSRRALLGLDRTAFGRAGADHDAVLARIRGDWAEPAREALLRAMEPAAEVVAQLAAPAPGERVLDAGAGDGNVALACARRGAVVEACDLAAPLVARGRARTGPAVRWREADLQELPYPAAAFDVVVCAFAAPWAPRPARALRELTRVCRPGGRLVLAAWQPRGLPGRLPELLELAGPPADGLPSPEDWGREPVLRRRLEAVLDDVEVRLRSVRLSFPSPEAFHAALVPERAGGPDVRARFDRLLASVNAGAGGVEVDARYLVAAGRRRATSA